MGRGRALERPSANASIVIVRVAFDIVHPDTLVPYPLDRIYNHHLVVHSRDDETDESELRRAVSEVLPELIPADVPPRPPPRSESRAAIRAATGAAPSAPPPDEPEATPPSCPRAA